MSSWTFWSQSRYRPSSVPADISATRERHVLAAQHGMGLVVRQSTETTIPSSCALRWQWHRAEEDAGGGTRATLRVPLTMPPPSFRPSLKRS